MNLAHYQGKYGELPLVAMLGGIESNDVSAISFLNTTNQQHSSSRGLALWATCVFGGKS
jgi:hypothetical protein